METPTLRARRLVRLGAVVLVLALGALAVAAGALVDAERRAGTVRRSVGRRAAVKALANALELASRSEEEWVELDEEFGAVAPPPPRRLVPTPPPAAGEDAFLLDLAASGDPPLRPRQILRVALRSESAATRLHAAAAGARMEFGPGGRITALDWWAARATDLGELEATREGIFLRLRLPSSGAEERALQAIGTPDETDAAALLVGAGRPIGMVHERRRQLALQAVATRLLPLAPEQPITDAEGWFRVAFGADGSALVGVRRPESPDVLRVAVLPANRVRAIATNVLGAHGVRLVESPGTGARGDALPLPGDAGLWVADAPDAGEHQTGFAPLLLVGLALSAAASLGAFGAFARGVHRNARLETLRSEFIATVGHELRTPVAVMRTSAETLALERATAPEDRRALATAIVRESERLSHLLGNVLDFARMESGKRHLAPRPLDVGELVRAAVDGHASALERADFRVDMDVEDGLPPVPCDRAAIGAALTNLLDNAVKFSPIRRDAAVRVRRRGAHVEIEVEDHGIGVPDGEKAAVFERFRRGGAQAVRETRGTGIGLSLVRHAVEAHGGSVSVHDTPDGGATFRLRLPLGEDGATGGDA